MTLPSSATPLGAAPHFVAVVGEDIDERAATACLLRSAGFHVRSYLSGEMLLREPAANEVDAVILHARRPGPRALGAVREVRGADDPPAALLLVESATALDAISAVRAGAFALIEKPCSPGRLVAAIRNAIAVGCRRGAPILEAA